MVSTPEYHASPWTSREDDDLTTQIEAHLDFSARNCFQKSLLRERIDAEKEKMLKGGEAGGDDNFGIDGVSFVGRLVPRILFVNMYDYISG